MLEDVYLERVQLKNDENCAKFAELERHWAVMKTYEGYPSGTTTINPAVIEGGRHAAFIADECRLWITVHFYPNETHEQIIKEIEEYIGKAAAADPWYKENPPQFKGRRINDCGSWRNFPFF